RLDGSEPSRRHEQLSVGGIAPAGEGSIRADAAAEALVAGEGGEGPARWDGLPHAVATPASEGLVWTYPAAELVGRAGGSQSLWRRPDRVRIVVTPAGHLSLRVQGARPDDPGGQLHEGTGRDLEPRGLVVEAVVHGHPTGDSPRGPQRARGQSACSDGRERP